MSENKINNISEKIEETVEEITAEVSNAETAEQATDIPETDEKVEDVAETFESTVDTSAETKSGRYQLIAELEQNLWTYGSPIIVEKGILEQDQITKKNVISLKFTNIYPTDIREVQLAILMKEEDQDDDNIEELIHVYKALGQPYLKSKGGSTKIIIDNPKASQFKVRVDKVVFADYSMWEMEDAYLESVGEIEDLDVFAQAKNKDYEDNYVSAVEAIEKDNSTSINDGIEILKRILWYKDANEMYEDAKEKYKIASLTEQRKKASEDRRASRQKAVKRRYMIAGVIIAIIVAVAVAATFLFFMPNKKYNAAIKIVEKGNYAEAAEKFDALNGFRDSEDYLAQCYYNLGLEQLANQDEEAAKKYFNQSVDSSKDSDYGVMAGAFVRYYEGVNYLEQQDYEKALECFTDSVNTASDFNLINKASAGMANVSFIQGNYKAAWDSIQNVYAKDESYKEQYGEYGYGYAKNLVENNNIEEGIKIYNAVSKIAKGANLNKQLYEKAVGMAEKGKIAEAMELLKKIKSDYAKANKLYEKMYNFNEKAQFWLGTWRHRGVVSGKKVKYVIKISQLLYKGEMCLKIKDLNNKTLGFETEISSKNRVTQIEIGQYILKFKLKKYGNQKFTYTLKDGKHFVRELKYAGEKYTSKYKKVK